MTVLSAASLVDHLEASSRRFPDHAAIVDPAGWSLTYRELDDLAGRIAGFLISAGVLPGDRVGVIVPKGAMAVAAFLGIMRARAAYVPADYLAPASRNATILADCGVRVAFLAAETAGAIIDAWPDAPLPSSVVSMGGTASPASAPGVRMHAWDEVTACDPQAAAGRRPSDLAYILYTSGSTGIPKGVMLTHENALAFVDWCSDVFAPSSADRFSSHAPFHFDLSVLDIYVALKHGATLYVVSEELGKSPKELAAFIADARLTVWYSTPSILTLLAELGNLASRDCSALRLVLFAGEVFPVKHLRALTRIWPGREYYNLYGPTETNVCTFARIPTPIPDERTEPFPIGFRCAHCEAIVLDADGREVPEGEEGLLHIAGPSVFGGYWNRPEQNARVFSEREGRRWYNTGDVVRSGPDGFLYVGRRDRMVKRRGYRIELGEVERGLYRHPSIAEAAVIAVSDAVSGTRIFAYLAPRSLERPSIVEMKMFCARELPASMSPDVFQFLPALPRTSTNKVDYQGLARLACGEAVVPERV
jgi:amino acid adenylation domain-containing protein